MKNTINFIDEHWRDNLQGLTFNARLQREIQKAHMNEILERSRHGIFESVVVAALKRGKIREIGFNDPADLILNNFGTWLAGFIRAPAMALTTISLQNITPAAKTLYLYTETAGHGTLLFNHCFASLLSLGTQLQLGSGSTGPLRTNTAIETAFGTAPESGRFATGVGSYAAGVISFSGAITAGGNGTVAESGFFGVWQDIAGSAQTFMLFHDLISPTVPFVAGNILTLSYVIAL